MNKNLKRCLEHTIKKEFVSVYHNYDTQETIYSIPYNASLATQSVKLILVRAMALDYDDDFDDKDSNDIETAARNLLNDGTPVFSLTESHFISKRNQLMTHYLLDFDGEALVEKSYPTDKLSKKNPLLQLMRKCSEKIVAQEVAAQAQKMEKMFISMNLFNECAQHDRR